MDETNEFDLDFKQYTEGIDPMTIEVIKLSERAKIFNNLRKLIQQKEFENDLIAASVLGWAYEKMAED